MVFCQLGLLTVTLLLLAASKNVIAGMKAACERRGGSLKTPGWWGAVEEYVCVVEEPGSACARVGRRGQTGNDEVIAKVRERERERRGRGAGGGC